MSMKLGRFKALDAELSDRPGVRNPAALAAAIGNAKYGKAQMQQMAAKGKKRKGSAAAALSR